MKIGNIEFFETERMIARRITPLDFDNIYQLNNNLEMAKTLGGTKTIEQVRDSLKKYEKQWETHGYGYWIFFAKDTLEFIGRGGLRHLTIEGQDEVEVGYAIMPQFWGKGYATEMGRVSIRVASQLSDIKSLVCFTMTTNEVSKAVMKKLGFIFERHFVYANIPHTLCRLRLVF
jgi:[ribosomal protein S5]-alanine N-acetyltransferase